MSTRVNEHHNPASHSGSRPGANQWGGGRASPTGEPDAPAIGDWLSFAPDGTVKVFSGKAEMGQGIRTSLAQAVAEELRLPLDRVRVILGDTALTPYDMGTFGSRTTPMMAGRLHKVAASARQLFVHRAASRMAVEQSELVAANGRITHPPTGRSLSYAELAEDAKNGRLSEPWSEDAPITPAREWKVAGKPAIRAGGRDFVTGRHRYTWDLSRPGMFAGAVLRHPTFGASLTHVDTTRAEAMPGVTVLHEGDFVGVVAPTRRAAREALAALQAEWQTAGSADQPDWQNIFDYLKAHPAEPDGRQRWGGPLTFEAGSLEAGRAAAEKDAKGHTLHATYTLPYIAHTPLEPRAALAEWQDGQITVWTGSQRPFGVRSEVATALNIPEEQVRVIVPDTGSAYGGKHTGDAAVEAARLSRAAGRPVKVVWSREEEMTWAYFRPAGVIEVSSAVTGDGTITAWEYHNYNSGSEAMKTPYAIANQHIEHHPSHSPLRQGSYRALAATANHFARESHMDELAALIGMDPLEFRLHNLPNKHDETEKRLRAALTAAAEAFGWASQRSQSVPGRGCGISCGTEKGSFVATCAEVEVEEGSGQVHVLRVVQAFECGAIVNPENLTNQIEGAVTQAIGGALLERIEFAQGKVLTDRLSRYHVPRFSDAPRIEVVLLDRKDLPSTGAGETPIVGLAPAVANAIHHATGQRLRDLPLTLPS